VQRGQVISKRLKLESHQTSSELSKLDRQASYQFRCNRNWYDAQLRNAAFL